MKAFVAGATGQTGQRVVRELVKRQIPVRALVRNLAAARAVLPVEAELVVDDIWQLDALVTALGDSTVVLSAMGSKPSFNPLEPYQVDWEGTRNLVDAAKLKGIEQFVLVSSIGASEIFHPLNLFWLVLVWKKRAEEYLQQSGLAYTIVRPGGLVNQDISEPIVIAPADTMVGLAGRISRQQAAQLCVEALFEPAAKSKIVEIVAQAGAPEKSWQELFASIPN